MTNLSLKDRIERLGRVPGAPRVTSGSSATIELQPPDNLRDLQTIPAIESLVRRGVRVPLAKAVIEDWYVSRRSLRASTYPLSRGTRNLPLRWPPMGCRCDFLIPSPPDLLARLCHRRGARVTIGKVCRTAPARRRMGACSSSLPRTGSPTRSAPGWTQRAPTCGALCAHRRARRARQSELLRAATGPRVAEKVQEVGDVALVIIDRITAYMAPQDRHPQDRGRAGGALAAAGFRRSARRRRNRAHSPVQVGHQGDERRDRQPGLCRRLSCDLAVCPGDRRGRPGDRPHAHAAGQEQPVGQAQQRARLSQGLQPRHLVGQMESDLGTRLGLGIANGNTDTRVCIPRYAASQMTAPISPSRAIPSATACARGLR